ncbi:unnamed protein product [Phytophthora fragariaefolia]|uniref:Unnamed protein product n=1 Tax=Phytophthora fragariaefolia TaxID=1490495 RepID=A0A9W6Y6H0_9STRA|nr:unnamed protein product [Phytophthora fragariaefolia]
MARWLSFFAEYNFVVHYKPGKNNILADALSRRPGYDPRVVLGRQVIDDEDDSEEHCAVCAASGINLTSVSPEMDLRGEIAAAYADDAVYANILAYLRSPSDETLGSRAIRETRLTATISTVTCCATTSIVSMLLVSSCPTTTIYGLFALNNAEHASTGVTPFFANNARHPRVPALLAVAHPTVPGASTLGGDDNDDDDDDSGVDDVVTSGDHDPEALHAVTRSKSKQALAAPSSATAPLAAWTARTLIDPGNTGTPIAANYTPNFPARQVDNAAVSAFVQRRESIARFVRDALQVAVDKQKENADKRGRKNMATFTIGEQVLVSTDSIRSSAVTNLGAIDSAGQTCWIVDRLVAHEDPPRATSHSWEPRSGLLRDVPDVVLEYENGIANESAAAAVPAATKTAIENPTVADLAATENANGHVATGMDPVVNEHGGLRHE